MGTKCPPTGNTREVQINQRDLTVEQNADGMLTASALSKPITELVLMYNSAIKIWNKLCVVTYNIRPC